MDPWVWGNAAFAVFPPVAVLGLGIDAVSGNWWRHQDMEVKPAGNPAPQVKPEVKPAGNPAPQVKPEVKPADDPAPQVKPEVKPADNPYADFDFTTPSKNK